jgi:hypothetical protein
LIGGSPRILTNSARRSGLAVANMICCASVVFPVPGPPAIKLKESSGDTTAQNLGETGHAAG